MPLRNFVNFKLIMSRRRKELRVALRHGLFGLCVNPSLHAWDQSTVKSDGLDLSSEQLYGGRSACG